MSTLTIIFWCHCFARAPGTNLVKNAFISISWMHESSFKSYEEIVLSLLHWPTRCSLSWLTIIPTWNEMYCRYHSWHILSNCFGISIGFKKWFLKNGKISSVIFFFIHSSKRCGTIDKLYFCISSHIGNNSYIVKRSRMFLYIRHWLSHMVLDHIVQHISQMPAHRSWWSKGSIKRA